MMIVERDSENFVERTIEAEALGYYSTFLVEHHFTGFGQVSATLNLLTWIGARTKTLRLGTAVIVLPWHNPVLLAEQIATWTCCLMAGSMPALVKVTALVNSMGFTYRSKRPMTVLRNAWRLIKALASDAPLVPSGYLLAVR